MKNIISIKSIKYKEGKNIFDSLLDKDEKGNFIISRTHINKQVIKFLKNYVNDLCKRIDIESPYQDKDYLSSVYVYYVKSNVNVIKWCYRLHIYGEDDAYYGYIVLRPTPYSNIGRIQADPRVFLKDSAHLITSKIKANITGVERYINCFSFSKQDPVVAMCAQVATCSILRFAHSCDWSYADMNLAEITDKTWTFSERKIPAKGLNQNHILEVLNSAGLYPLLNGASKESSLDFGEILAYIQSNIPIIALLGAEKHAIALIGHGKVDSIPPEADLSDYYESINGEKSSIIMYHKFIPSLWVNDDNFAPYQQLSLKLNLTNTPTLPYDISSVESFIVPLSEKMYISYHNVYSKVMTYLQSGSEPFPNEKVVRIYLTSSKSFKKKTLEKDMNAFLKKTIRVLNMASFIWCVEISGISNHNNNLVDGLIIFDATRHTEDEEPWLLVQSSNTISIFDGDGFQTKSEVIEPYKRYENLEVYDCGKGKI